MRRVKTLPLVIGLTLLPAAAGLAQGVPVFDQSAIQAAQQNLQTLQQQVQQLTSLVQTAQATLRSIGAAGPLTITLQAGFAASGIGQFSSQSLTSVTGGNTAFSAQLSPVLAQLGQFRGQAAALQNPDFSSFSGAQQWVAAATQPAPSASASERVLNRQARQLIAGESAADGYALALTARSQGTASTAQLQTLAGQVGAATSLREDMAANSAIMLALHDRMMSVQALLAAMLAVESSETLLNADDAASSASAGP